MRLLLLLSVLICAPAFAGQLALNIEIPRLDVAEYHRPYAAIWIEGEDQKVVTNLAVWYQLDKEEETGEEWLKDMRQWWRRSGRTLDMPIDGISGATRAPGTHAIIFTEGEKPLGKLAAGKYQLIIEAAREVGGRELVKIPFQWPPKKEESINASGENELGKLTLTLIP